MSLPVFLLPRSAPREGAGAAICPHCWMVNPGPFRLCVRCGADMRTYLQESGGMRRAAPVQSPVPVAGGPPLTGLQRVLLAGFLVMLALGHILAATAPRLPAPPTAGAPAPASSP